MRDHFLLSCYKVSPLNTHMSEIFAPRLENPLRTFLWAVIPIALMFTANWAYDFYQSATIATTIEQQLAVTNSYIKDSVPKAVPMPPPPVGGGASNHDPVIEVSALGAQLKMVNEASWTAILKIIVLWSCILSSLAVYHIVVKRYARDGV